MNNPMLENVSLCAIVRDEMMNPAGGITDFVESTVPYVGEAVIVDTGSVDGTKDELVELSGKYPNLKLFSHRWKGYANARNKSLTFATKEYILILDADERLTRRDFQELDNFMRENPTPAYDFEFTAVKPNGESKSDGHNPRLFLKNLGAEYVDIGGIFEKIVSPLPITADVPVAIKHFLPITAAHKRKISQWYLGALFGARKGAPSQTPGFSDWKAYNPLREKYR